MPLKRALLLALDLPEADWQPSFGAKEEVCTCVRACVDGWMVGGVLWFWFGGAVGHSVTNAGPDQVV